MKYSTIFFLLFLFTNCASQQRTFSANYLDSNMTLQRYKDIKTKYGSLAKDRKDNLTTFEGGLYKTDLFDKENREKIFEPLKSKSRLLLIIGNEEIFIKNSTGGDYLYISKNGELIEKVHLAKDINFINSIDSFKNNISVNYHPDDSIYIYYFELNNKGDREVILEQKFINNELVLERNYKQDFKISISDMLLKLPNRFYNSAIQYTKEEKFENLIKNYNYSEDELAEFRLKIKTIKEELETALITKIDLSKEFRIRKIYEGENVPLYSLVIPMNHLQSWSVKIDPITGEVRYIDFIQYKE